MDIIFDRIPETAVNNELYGMKLLTQKAVRLWNSWSKDKPAAAFFKKYDALVKDNDRLNDLDFLVDTYVLNVLSETEDNLEIYNPILEFVMIAREVGLKTNRLSY
jgi:hypothetical protein